MQLNTILLLLALAIDAQTRSGLVAAADGGHVRVIAGGALGRNLGDGTTAAAAAKLLVELLLEGLAQEPQGKRVDTGVGEHQDSSDDTADEVCQRSVHLRREGKGAGVRGHQRVRRHPSPRSSLKVTTLKSSLTASIMSPLCSSLAALPAGLLPQ